MDHDDNRTGIYHTFSNGERREIVIELADDAVIEGVAGALAGGAAREGGDYRELPASCNP